MSKIAEEDLNRLTQLIVDNIKENFATKKLSGNLINTIQVYNTESGVKIEIPARTYNMLLFQKQGVVVPTSHGSYASKLDDEGSSFIIYPGEGRGGSYRIYPRNHKNFVETAISNALNVWLESIKSKYDVIKIG